MLNDVNIRLYAMNDDSSLSRAERNRQQLRADIIQAAFTEFSERGYHQTAISDIAKRLGIGHGTFYRHFTNKRDILEHVIDDIATKIIATLEAENAPDAVTSLDAYKEQCARIAQRLSEVLTANPAIARLILLEATSIDAEMTKRLMNLIDWGGQLVAAYMINGVKLGYFRQDLDCQATGHAVVGMILVCALRFLNNPNNQDEQQRLAVAVQRLLVDGIKI